MKSVGALTGSTRTADQTETALFWVENSTDTWNRIARIAGAAHHNNLIENARLFALLNMAGADGIIAGFKAKYTFQFWRPVTAIQNADTATNPLTTPDPSWLPLQPTPPFPDYPSNHSIYSAAAATVLTLFFEDDDFHFSISTSTSPNSAVRSYSSFAQAAAECGMARILVGFHLRSAVHDGLHLGRRIGNWTFRNYLRPMDDGGHE